MWIFTTTGFVSAVSNGKDLVVRSRDRLSLEPVAVACNALIRHTPESDYPYRVEATHEAFADWLSEMTRGVDYRNFKSEVSIHRGPSFEESLLRVWSVMHSIEEKEARQ